MLATILIGVGIAVVGFIAGVLVGRANSKTVTTAIADVKTAVADVKTEVEKLTGTTPKATTPTTGSAAVAK